MEMLKISFPAHFSSCAQPAPQDRGPRGVRLHLIWGHHPGQRQERLLQGPCWVSTSSFPFVSHGVSCGESQALPHGLSVCRSDCPHLPHLNAWAFPSCPLPNFVIWISVYLFSQTIVSWNSNWETIPNRREPSASEKVKKQKGNQENPTQHLRQRFPISAA